MLMTDSRRIVFDRGVGASTIYPLLFTAVDTCVKMIGTGK